MNHTKRFLVAVRARREDSMMRQSKEEIRHWEAMIILFGAVFVEAAFCVAIFLLLKFLLS